MLSRIFWINYLTRQFPCTPCDSTVSHSAYACTEQTTLTLSGSLPGLLTPTHPHPPLPPPHTHTHSSFQISITSLSNMLILSSFLATCEWISLVFFCPIRSLFHALSLPISRHLRFRNSPISNTISVCCSRSPAGIIWTQKRRSLSLTARQLVSLLYSSSYLWRLLPPWRCGYVLQQFMNYSKDYSWSILHLLLLLAHVLLQSGDITLVSALAQLMKFKNTKRSFYLDVLNACLLVNLMIETV